jgi:hypothetical protein
VPLEQRQNAVLAGQVRGTDGDEGAALVEARQHALDHAAVAVVQ